jgi:hypothetical protein
MPGSPHLLSRLMSQLANQWIEVFRAHKGENGEFTEQDVQKIVDNYNPSFHEVPVVIGHPKGNAPAFGWVEKLRRVGNVLEAKFRDVNADFEQMVKDRRFSKRSVSIYPDEGAGPSLRHVGFLGAMPPVVKGLADIKFDEEDKKAIEIEFSEGDIVAELNQADRKGIVTDVIDGLKALWGSKPGDVAPKTFSEDEVKRMVTEAAKEAVKATNDRIAQVELSFSEREKSLATGESKSRAEAAIAKLKNAGKWVPAFDKMGIPQLFAELATETRTLEFGEGDAKQKKSSLDILLNFMEQSPKIVPAGEVYGGGGAPGSAPARGINAGTRGVDDASVRLDQAVKDFAEKNKVSYTEALVKVLDAHPELDRPGASSAGAV